jgi:hypothetical protein
MAFASLALGVACFAVSLFRHGDFWFRMAALCAAVSAVCGLGAFVLTRRTGLSPRVRSWLTVWAVAFSVSIPVVPFASGACTAPRDAAHRMDRTNKIKDLASAMHSYAEKHDGRMPPAALRDKAGRPLLSWRVLILPQLGEEALYEEFHLDEPWDSPHNLPLMDRMPAVYRASWPDPTPPPHTRFQVFVGPGTPFEIAEGPHFLRDFPDGSYETLLIAEATDPVPWTKPADLDYSPDRPLPPLGPNPGPGWPLFSPGGTYAFACADGSATVRYHNGRPSKQTLRHLIVRNDGVGWGEDR